MKRLLALVLFTTFLLGCGAGYSDGDRVGVVTKFSHKGLVCKTWEGDMNLGGYKTQTDDKGNASIVANVWSFHVEDGPLVAKVQTAMTSGKTVKVHYSQWIINPPCKSDSHYWLTDVEVLP
jgi:hypothetical protein